VVYDCVVADLRHANGIKPTFAFSDAIKTVKRMEVTNGSSNELLWKLFETMGKTGAFGLVDHLRNETWWKPDPAESPPTNMDLAVASGCAETGRFDDAIAYLRRNGEYQSHSARGIARTLCLELANANQLNRAEAVRKEFLPGVPLSDLRKTTEFVAARGRRGEDVLSTAPELTEEDEVNDRVRKMTNPSDVDHQAVAMANAAIATIEYTLAMKNRIAEYEKR
jgi:hypothetical protein